MENKLKACPIKFCNRIEKHDHTKTALIKKLNEIESELNQRTQNARVEETEKARALLDDLTAMAYLVEDWKEASKREISTRDAKLNDMTKDRDEWKRDSLMWSGAWERELHGYYVNKTHRIDAAVISTRKIIERLKTCEIERDEVHAKNKELSARLAPQSVGEAK